MCLALFSLPLPAFLGRSLPFWQNACTRLVNRYEGILVVHLAHSTTGHFIGLKIARIT